MVDKGFNYYKAICDTMIEGYCLVTEVKDANDEVIDYGITECNDQLTRLIDLAREEIVGNTAREISDTIDRNWQAFNQNMPKGEEKTNFEMYFKHLDKFVSITAFKVAENEILVLLLDITVNKKAKDAIRVHEAIFENAHDIILYVTMDGRIYNANKIACEKYGYSKEELISMRMEDIRHPFTMDEYEKQMYEADNGGVIFECVHMRSDGSTFHVEVSAKHIYTRRGNFRMHIIRDITQRKKDAEKIEWLAKFDALTGIPNRASFIMYLEEQVRISSRDKTPFAVMLFDIDKFKYINDNYGHEAGDVILKHVAQSAQNTLRITDKIARLGGDEFVILQANTNNHDDIHALAKRIQSAVNEPITYKGVQFRVNISIGISTFPEDAMDVAMLLHCADNAMYQIKHTGGGRYSFFSSAYNYS